MAEPSGQEQVASLRRLWCIPEPIFDLWRLWDRRGGTKSSIVARFTGKDAEEETKKLQVRFNEQSRTPIWWCIAFRLLPDYSSGNAQCGISGEQVWSGI